MQLEYYVMEFAGFFEYIKVPSTVAHVISVVFGMGSALVSDILFSFFAKDKKLNATEISTLTILRNVVSYSLIIIAISGIMILLSDFDGYSHSTKFLAKMSILLILLVNGYALNKYIWPHLLNKNFFTLKKERNVRKLAFVCGAISVISWLAVCALGILDGINASYGTIISLYLVTILVGGGVALLVEKHEFN